jgi:outer membrane lipoprotein-sorting protein
LLRLDYDPPSQLVMISNGVTLSVEDRGRRTQNFYALERTPLAPILAQYTDLMSEDLVRDVILDSQDYIVVVLAQADDGGWLSLYFDRETYELHQWVTIDARGNTITFIMVDVEINQPVDAAHFVITNMTSE